MKILSKVNIISGASLGTIIALAFTSFSVGAGLPQHLQLKADKTQILGTKRLKNGDLKYAYKSNVKVSEAPTREISLKAAQRGLQVNGEIVEKRTRNSRTFSTNQS